MMHVAPQVAGPEPRVLIIHDFAETYGGAERIVAEIARSFSDVGVVAIAGRREVAERMGVGDRFETILPERSRLLSHYRKLAPLYPLVAAAIELPAADLLISSSYAFAHGFRTRNGAPHLSYCYSPLRFAWTMTDEYGRQALGPRLGAGMRGLSAPFRSLDRRASRRVDRYIAESGYVATQLRDFFDRDSEVIHPPVDCELFSPGTEAPGDYTLMCGRLVEPYKRPGIVVEAFRRMPERRLVIAGDGPELERLRAIAPANVELVGRLEDAALVDAMRRCSFAIFPSRDDFGLVPVEVMACGRPVLAYAGGGALETVVPGVTGELFDLQTPEAVVSAVEAYEPTRYLSAAIRAHAEGWEAGRFRERIRAAATELLSAEV